MVKDTQPEIEFYLLVPDVAYLIKRSVVIPGDYTEGMKILFQAIARTPTYRIKTWIDGLPYIRTPAFDKPGEVIDFGREDTIGTAFGLLEKSLQDYPPDSPFMFLMGLRNNTQYPDPIRITGQERDLYGQVQRSFLSGTDRPARLTVSGLHIFAYQQQSPAAVSLQRRLQTWDPLIPIYPF